MSLKDKLEIGLKPDAPYRPDNLPAFQQDDPACDTSDQPGDTGRLRKAREQCDVGANLTDVPPAKKPAKRHPAKAGARRRPRARRAVKRARSSSR